MSVTITFNTAADAGLTDLNTFLESRSYIIGFVPTQSDVVVASALKGAKVDADKYANVARYLRHINSFSAEAQARFPAGLAALSTGAAGAAAAAKPAAAAGKPAAKAAAKPAESEDESDDDMFASSGDEKPDKKAAAKAAAAAKAKAAAAEKPKKEAPVERTQCVYEVKPAEAGQDMADLERRVRTIEREGLSWGQQFKVVDVAFGIQKLIIQFLVDERCGLQEVEDAITDLGEDYVSSVDLCSMNRL